MANSETIVAASTRTTPSSAVSRDRSDIPHDRNIAPKPAKQAKVAQPR
jgi:hypothetical protein